MNMHLETVMDFIEHEIQDTALRLDCLKILDHLKLRAVWTTPRIAVVVTAFRLITDEKSGFPVKNDIDVKTQVQKLVMNICNTYEKWGVSTWLPIPMPGVRKTRDNEGYGREISVLAQYAETHEVPEEDKD